MSRCSRHYYDIYQLCNSEFKDQTLQDIDLLNKVREYKNKYYYVSWDNYKTVKPDTMKLLPSDKNLKLLELDYKVMQNMLYDKYLIFEKIVAVITKLEKEINSLQVNF